MGEGHVEIEVNGAELQHIKPGKEHIYAVVSVGQKVVIGEEAILNWTVLFPKTDNNGFELFNSRQVINVVLYVRPKQKNTDFQRASSLDIANESAASAVEGGAGDKKGKTPPMLKRTDSLSVGDADGEGAIAKLIKKKEVLIGKGSAPRLFDRVTISAEFAKVYISPVTSERIGTIKEIHKGGAECTVEWDPLPATLPETPRTPPTHKEEVHGLIFSSFTRVLFSYACSWC
jgi:hypothetical protein